MIIIEVYADDIIFRSDDDRLSQKFSKDMQKEFEMSLLGELRFSLGLQISQQVNGIFISQSKYIKEMLKRFQMEECKPVSTSMITSWKLSKDDTSLEVDQKLQRSMIGSLLYVTTSRPDVLLAVGLVGRFQAPPRENHLQAVKRIFRYLKGKTNFGLWYPKGRELTLVAYTDANQEGDVDDRKSTSGGAFYLGECLVAWLSRKQSLVSLSTVEAEYIDVAACCTKILWMKQTLQDIYVQYNEPLTILSDNTSAISISKNLVMHSIAKHIHIRYHFVRDHVLEKTIKL